MRRPLRVVYADHSRLEHHGVATGDVTVVLMWAFELVCGGFRFLECVKFSPWGRISAPTGVAPEVLEECLHSSKGYKYRPAWLTDWGDCSASFSAGISVPFSRPSILHAGTATRGPVEPSGGHALRVGVLAKHVELHNRRCAWSPRALACVKAFRGPSTFITTLVALPQRGGVKRTMLSCPGRELWLLQ